MTGTSHAQWLKITLPDIPRNADGTPNLSAPAPRGDDGRLDLSGIWRLNPAAAVRRPALLKQVTEGVRPVTLTILMPEGTDIPLLPAAAALYKVRSEQLGKGSPHSRCLPNGIEMIFGNMKLVQTRRLTVMLFEEFNHYRQVFTDGRSHPQNDPEPTWFGYSIGRWDGDTFVVETMGFNDRSWMDDAGLPHSEALHTTERFTRRDFGHLDVRTTFDDAKSYRQPWSIDLPFDLLADTEQLEHICENERDSAHMVGK